MLVSSVASCLLSSNPVKRSQAIVLFHHAYMDTCSGLGVCLGYIAEFVPEMRTDFTGSELLMQDRGTRGRWTAPDLEEPTPRRGVGRHDWPSVHSSTDENDREDGRDSGVPLYFH